MTHRHRPEQQLQIAVVRFLDQALPNSARCWHTPNGGWRTKAEAGGFKAMGVRLGMPDLFVFHDKQLFAIELKAGRTIATDAQQAMLDALHIAGAKTAVCRSLEEVEKFLAAFMPLKGRLAA